jgi:DNA-nicking Smr family endonuclease
VRPAHGRGPDAARLELETLTVPAPAAVPPPPKTGKAKAKAKSDPPRAKPAAPPGPPALDRIEPNRQRRIIRERDPLERRLDLHGLDQDRARSALLEFLRRAQQDGVRAVLVITGKGLQGDGVLRRRAPEWLAEPGLRSLVAGVSPADRRHGGDGALYVALKRRV